MTVPTFVAAGTAASGTGAVTPGEPAGIQADDILILHIEGEGEDSNADAAPSGGDWTTLDDDVGGDGSISSGTNGASDKTRHTVYWHRYDGATSPSYSVPDAGNHIVCRVSAWRGCETSGSPIHVYASRTDGTNDTNGQAAAVTTTVNDCLILVSASQGDQNSQSSWANASLANPSLTRAVYNSTTSGSDGRIMCYYGGLETAGDSGQMTWTISSSEEEANWTLALMEPQGAPAALDGHGLMLDSERNKMVI